MASKRKSVTKLLKIAYVPASYLKKRRKTTKRKTSTKKRKTTRRKRRTTKRKQALL